MTDRRNLIPIFNVEKVLKMINRSKKLKKTLKVIKNKKYFKEYHLKNKK